MLKIWKRLWIPAFILVLIIIGSVLSESFEGDLGGGIAALTLFLMLLFVVALVWAIVKSVRQTIRVKKGIEPLPGKSQNSVSIAAHSITEHYKERIGGYQGMNDYMKKKFWVTHIIGAAIMAVGVLIFIPLTTASIIIGTIVFIIGMAVYISLYLNSYSDQVKMIPLDSPTTIEEVFEKFKDYNTPLGTPSLVRMKLCPTPAMIYGPDNEGLFLYCYLNKEGRIFYLGESFINTTTEVITESLNPYREIDETNYSLKDLVCLNSAVWLLRINLFDVFSEYFKSGNIPELKKLPDAKVYTFDETFNLLGQEFNLHNLNREVVYRIKGTYPLASLSIYDPEDNTELLKMAKQIDEFLPTYNFYKDGKFYSTFHKDASLYKDKFFMEVPEGKIELIENALTIGDNYTVYLNGEVIATIMDNLELTIRNIVFDNSILFVYNKKYTELITAMAVMVARERARDAERISTMDAEKD